RRPEATTAVGVVTELVHVVPPTPAGLARRLAISRCGARVPLPRRHLSSMRFRPVIVGATAAALLLVQMSAQAITFAASPPEIVMFVGGLGTTGATKTFDPLMGQLVPYGFKQFETWGYDNASSC